ncbi:MAG: thiamine pyrophosphate-dependent enzyme [Microscillaceae bacterium]|jgi:pyruvate/2-oxoglutarate/acetoin dehydrogenase E1 component/TPP-dependent pyruvate/acetoin dehydrogenase alpha subunit|nr:thiamine pyrophosphate-dependent enzyme [Microscillaceae bacterium]
MLAQNISEEMTLTLSKESVLKDYRLVCESRQVSLLGRKEVFMGRAKFGIFGDGKELAQIAMAHAFQWGDWRSGYYRDQTFMFAIGELSYQQYFAQLYAHPDLAADPASAGRMMNSHFVTRSHHEDGSWKDLTQMYNSAADLSPTAGQIPRVVGLGYASKLYRQNPDLQAFTQFSNNGNEIAFGTIGNASTSEGLFLEAMNAIGVLQIPVIMSVWDDEYGISVPQKYHTVKESISKALAGYQRTEADPQGFEIFVVRAWDYTALLDTYLKAAEVCRREHVPVLIHVTEVTQQQGHSTSGSHERYKSKERLEWEKEYDCNKKFGEWILANGYATEDELQEIEEKARKTATQAKVEAWKAYTDLIKADYEEALRLLKEAEQSGVEQALIHNLLEELQKTIDPMKHDSVRVIKKALRVLRHESLPVKTQMQNWLARVMDKSKDEFNSHLYNETPDSALNVPEVKAIYDAHSKVVDGREVVQACFDAMFARNPLVFAIGEDVGKIGDVNQGFAGLQDKYGELRVTDTSIRETTIIGQGVGAALRGLRPIVEIQYLDYIFYALQTMTDDLACLHYRTKGGQKAPLIIRTRGHRLEGIWHSGSPMGTLLHCLRGIHILVPRNMTQAAGFYNTLLQAQEPALVIECLNGYRLKEPLPANVGEFTVPLGVPEVLREGKDVTILTYGSMCRIVMDAANQLAEVGIQCEVIDAQTLIPFDLGHQIVKSIQKTNRIIFADEDVSGGATAYMMQKVLEEQNAYRWLDSKPLTISAQDHRPAYGSDGDYFSKPNIETVFDTVYQMMQEADPDSFPKIY